MITTLLVVAALQSNPTYRDQVATWAPVPHIVGGCKAMGWEVRESEVDRQTQAVVRIGMSGDFTEHHASTIMIDAMKAANQRREASFNRFHDLTRDQLLAVLPAHEAEQRAECEEAARLYPRVIWHGAKTDSAWQNYWTRTRNDISGWAD